MHIQLDTTRRSIEVAVGCASLPIVSYILLLLTSFSFPSEATLTGSCPVTSSFFRKGARPRDTPVNLCPCVASSNVRGPAWPNCSRWAARQSFSAAQRGCCWACRPCTQTPYELRRIQPAPMPCLSRFVPGASRLRGEQSGMGWIVSPPSPHNGVDRMKRWCRPLTKTFVMAAAIHPPPVSCVEWD